MSPSGDGWFGRPILRPAKEPPLPQIQHPAGHPLDAAGTSKGVFVTTSDFTNTAKDYVARSPKRIVLIDGKALARLMVTHDIGVRRKVRYEVKRIDEDYFGLEDL